MTGDQPRAAVRDAVAAAMTARGWYISDLARSAGVGADTVGDFLGGRQWPMPRTQGRLERALDWEPGTIRAALADPTRLPAPEWSEAVAS